MGTLNPPDGFELNTGVWGTDADREESTVRLGNYGLVYNSTAVATELRTDYIPIDPTFSAYYFRYMCRTSSVAGGNTHSVELEYFDADKVSLSTGTFISGSQNSAINTWEAFSLELSNLNTSAAYLKIGVAKTANSFSLTFSEFSLCRVSPYWDLVWGAKSVNASTWTPLNIALTAANKGTQTDATADTAGAYYQGGMATIFANTSISVDSGSYTQLRLALVGSGTTYVYGPPIHNHGGGSATRHPMVMYMGPLSSSVGGTKPTYSVELWHNNAAATSNSAGRFSGNIHI